MAHAHDIGSRFFSRFQHGIVTVNAEVSFSTMVANIFVRDDDNHHEVHLVLLESAPVPHLVINLVGCGMLFLERSLEDAHSIVLAPTGILAPSYLLQTPHATNASRFLANLRVPYSALV